jgi:tripartite-type tricarboxylate transporter receptor subunit TctC
LNVAINNAIKRPDVVELWAKQGAVPMSMTPTEFGQFLRGDITKWANVVKTIDNKAQ